MVYAVIVTYNPDKILLESQRLAIERQVDKIVYIDNGSSDDIISVTEKCILVRNYHNLGLGKAQNQGIQIAIKEGAEFVLLLDQDSIPSNDYVKSLLRIYDEIKDSIQVGLIGPAIQSAYGDIASLGYGVKINHLRLQKVLLKRVTEVSYCIASGSLIPSYVFNRVGLIEEKLFIDGLDLEWCLRARTYGYAIIQTNTTSLLHRLGEGKDDRILSHSPAREYYIVRNSIWLSKQSYIPFGYRLRKKITPLVRLFISMIKGQKSYVVQQIRGLKDGYSL